MIKQLYQGK